MLLLLPPLPLTSPPLLLSRLMQLRLSVAMSLWLLLL